MIFYIFRLKKINNGQLIYAKLRFGTLYTFNSTYKK